MKYKRKKKTRMRGSHTHGWGAMKKHRGAGNRGGRGMAGSGKRADQKKPSILKIYGNKYLGKKGFNRPQKIIKKLRSINIFQLKQFDKTEINLTELGYDKLLATGSLDKKYKVTIKQISKSAKDKIEKAGGEIIQK